MDLETWEAFAHLAHPGKHEIGTVDLRLEDPELRAWEHVSKTDRMLEQEHLPQAAVEKVLRRAFGLCAEE